MDIAKFVYVLIKKKKNNPENGTQFKVINGTERAQQYSMPRRSKQHDVAQLSSAVRAAHGDKPAPPASTMLTYKGDVCQGVSYHAMLSKWDTSTPYTNSKTLLNL